MIAAIKMCSIAFKEWAGVVAALADGRQSLILRKGGIAEGPRGFAPEHSEFWLYPTHVHEAEQGLRTHSAGALDAAAAHPARVPIDVLVAVESIGYASRFETLTALEPLHVWTAETVRKRFDYKRPGLWVLGVRALRRGEPAWVEATAEQAGCKTWVELGRAIDLTASTAAVYDDTHARRMAAIADALENDA